MWPSAVAPGPVTEASAAAPQRSRPLPEEYVIHKEHASAFAGTALVGHLLARRVDTLLIMDRIRVNCYFDGTLRSDLARIKPGEVVTIRGVVREMKDHLNYMVDPNVEVIVKNCGVVVGAQ